MNSAHNILTLDSCRTLSIANNKDLRISFEKINTAHYRQKAAFTGFLPKVDAMGTYTRTQKEISILSDKQKEIVSNIGGATQNSMQETFRQMTVSNPELNVLLQPLASLVPGIGQTLNDLGKELVDAMHTDTRNVYAGTVAITQPLYMGGKIVAYNKITRYAEQLAKSQHAADMQDIILSTDQAYWQVVSLVNKKKLVESYLKLVKRLDEDMSRMMTEGVTTKADMLSVEVKVNEAEMKLTQVKDGLSLSRMVLCQICGLPLNSEICLADENVVNLSLLEVACSTDNVATAMANREELKSLDLAIQIYEQTVNVIRADFLPTIALTANYTVTNPSFVNGFEKKFRGMWTIGALIKVPVWNWGEGFYKVRAAKTETNIARYQLSDAREKIELQVNQASFKVNEAAKKLVMALKNREKAEENLRYANLSFGEGVIPVNNVLEAQFAWLSAQSDKIDAEIDVKLAEVYLCKSVGTLK